MTGVEIVTIGDELLIGQVIDTNSAWMAQELNREGFDVLFKSTVGDNEEDILNAINTAFSRTSVVLLTGGIGPTKDDITKKTLCKYFDTRLIFDETTLKNVEEVVSSINRTLNELTRNQAYVPEKCTVIQNKMGTAPITWFERGGKILVSMPGVPYEMKWVMSEEVIPRLKTVFKTAGTIIHHTYWVANYSESMLAIHLEAFEDNLPEFVRLAYLPTSGLIRLRLTGRHDDERIVRQQMDILDKDLSTVLGDDIVAREDKLVEELLFDLLKKEGLTVSTAESCTGGRIATLITSIPGSSVVFKGAVVSYSNEAKMDVLGVDSTDINQYGAVSQSVVGQMAEGVRKIMHTDCSIATSGIAGPDGGTTEKPVGTVWISVCYKDKSETRKYVFSKNRESNILRSANTGMLMLYNMIKSSVE